MTFPWDHGPVLVLEGRVAGVLDKQLVDTSIKGSKSCWMLERLLLEVRGILLFYYFYIDYFFVSLLSLCEYTVTVNMQVSMAPRYVCPEMFDCPNWVPK